MMVHPDNQVHEDGQFEEHEDNFLDEGDRTILGMILTGAALGMLAEGGTDAVDRGRLVSDIGRLFIRN